MKVSDFIAFCQHISDDTEIEALGRSDSIKEGCGVGVLRFEYYLTSNDKDGKVFIRLE